MKSTIILDNGGGEIKCGLASDRKPSVRFPHTLEGAQITTDIFSQKNDEVSPVVRGYPVDLYREEQVWNHAFKELNVDSHGKKLILTIPPFLPTALESDLDEILFEKFGFENVTKDESSVFEAAYVSTKVDPLVKLVVDVGHSFSHVTAVFNNIPIIPTIRRLDIGGAFMTNHMTELISLRQYNMEDDIILMKKVKEALCYVSNDFTKDLYHCQFAKNKIRRNYLLPDQKFIMEGRVMEVDEELPPEMSNLQTLVLENERFTVPESLFRPKDVGLKQGGIADTIFQSLNALPECLRPMACGCISVNGGLCKLPGFQERLSKELRTLLPIEYPMNLMFDDEPELVAYKGANILARNKEYLKIAGVSKAEYYESGTEALRRRINEHRETSIKQIFAIKEPSLEPLEEEMELC
eukprot:TRINITY_DN13828_c0_g1_i1.p1 TRINITY_DN13828_c0_g1~~TRINITY_DN13828_c0_g1_i1.p1  ORF type:complete len:410 (-),score=99.47 TRINITY_DN13828_c0_g1_i1:282-1511(-)